MTRSSAACRVGLRRASAAQLDGSAPLRHNGVVRFYAAVATCVARRILKRARHLFCAGSRIFRHQDKKKITRARTRRAR